RAARGRSLRPLPPRPRPRGRGARAARADLRGVYRGLRHARPRRGEGAARGARLTLATPITLHLAAGPCRINGEATPGRTIASKPVDPVNLKLASGMGCGHM